MSQQQPADRAIEGNYDPTEIEPKWQDHWVDHETYAYRGDSGIDPDLVYAIDTPPPTVSGSLHMGHLYGHTLQDFAARFHRMAGEHAFFPFGYDDNGIASERLTERELGVRHQDFTRREFQEKCRQVCREYEADFTREMQALATSIDWSHTYKTIEPRVQRISQLSFVDLYEKGREYRKKAPAIWCPDCETAISQVEMEDSDRPSEFVDLAFELVESGSEPPADADEAVATDQGDDLVISTTRPELLPACVAMFVHPDDEENAHLVGGTARVPLFDHEVPIYEDERVDMETGTGVVMCCTFGDQTDIEWYQAHNLDLRVAIDESATLTELAGEYEGLSTEEARDAIKDDLEAAGVLRDRDPITHAVKVHERCEVPIEFRVTEQWYIDILDRREDYLEAGREMEWFPEKMLTRYEHWIEGLEWDWLISRQRDSGIPFPVWYCTECNEEIIAAREQLPVDPIEDEPPVEACPECGSSEFEPEEDVFDTWATSSLTPLINAGWDWDADAETFSFEHPELYPMDLRPQGHDIISFWLFHTVVKCLEHTGEVPFDSVLINGWVLDENREKMSKSKGNVILPAEIMEEYPVDAIRYWAASSSVGDDFPFKVNEMRQGERLVQKIWNASKLVDGLTPDTNDEPTDLAAIDRWLLAKLDEVVSSLTKKFEAHEYSKARDELRVFFWNTFCDDYLEIAKQRSTDGTDASTGYTLATAHETFLRLFAPLLPHVTEEIWQAMYAAPNDESVHRTNWPDPRGYDADLAAGETALAVISALRRYKTDNDMALNEPLDTVEVYGDVEGFEDAIGGTMHVGDIQVHDDAPDIETKIADIDLDYSLVGPEFGQQVGDIEAAIASGEFEIEDDHLHVAGVELSPDMFDIEEERTYSGTGDMIETENAVVVVH